MKYSVESIFENVLKREMEILISESSKDCQSGDIIELATNRLIECYFIKNEFEKMKKSRDFERNINNKEKHQLEKWKNRMKELKEAKKNDSK